MAEDAIKLVLSKLRPQIINLIELSGFTDSVLTSAIGNSYGDIYETHFEWAKNSRLNKTKGNIANGWEEHIMPILKGKM